MSSLIIGINLEREQGLSVALESRISAVNEIAVGALVRQRQSIEAAGEDGLDGAVRRGRVRHRAGAREFESNSTVGLS